MYKKLEHKPHRKKILNECINETLNERVLREIWGNHSEGKYLKREMEIEEESIWFIPEGITSEKMELRKNTRHKTEG